MQYKKFTTEFDEVVLAKELFERAPIDPRPVSSFISLENELSYPRLSKIYFDELLPKTIAKITSSLSQSELSAIQKNIAISFLIDHSGSLMSDEGEGSLIARLAAEILSGTFCLLGWKHEVLGFTTRSWQGGFSRKKWSQLGEVSKPGRLCDLLHIVYKSFDGADCGPSPYLSNLFRRDLLKENIDGEAIEWAEQRLSEQTERRKILILLSDGAPVDDSTQMENEHNLLSDHLKSVLDKVKIVNGTELKGIGIKYSLNNIIEDSITLTHAHSLEKDLFLFVQDIFHAPTI